MTEIRADDVIRVPGFYRLAAGGDLNMRVHAAHPIHDGWTELKGVVRHPDGTEGARLMVWVESRLINLVERPRADPT